MTTLRISISGATRATKRRSEKILDCAMKSRPREKNTYMARVIMKAAAMSKWINPIPYRIIRD
jgi:hypothetical protein